MPKSRRRRRVDAAGEGNESNTVSMSSLADMYCLYSRPIYRNLPLLEAE